MISLMGIFADIDKTEKMAVNLPAAPLVNPPLPPQAAIIVQQFCPPIAFLTKFHAIT
jgi:hypothetical protein